MDIFIAMLDNEYIDLEEFLELINDKSYFYVSKIPERKQ